MDQYEWLFWQHPITGFCRDDGLLKVEHLSSMEEVESRYKNYKFWCEKHGFSKVCNFNQFIGHLHHLLQIVRAPMFMDHVDETGLPFSEFNT